MHYPPQNVAFVDRWPLLEVGPWTVLLTFELKLKADNIFSLKENIFS